MSGKKVKYLLIALGALLVIWFIKDAFTQPSIDDLSGEFNEVAFYRNENNTGPIQRIYAVTVEDTLWDQMQQYGEFMPHTKYGTTRIYFFLQNQPFPETIAPGQDNFDAQYQKHCLAKYEKDAMGQVSFVKWPFR
ncbi:hypothetical protein [Nibribacter koreensis]|uniref:Uncharacterized protein n=1 Tax=Nibribacter koreensis TaxID=1084519 RepID=A0ABP8FWG5_9BACT